MQQLYTEISQSLEDSHSAPFGEMMRPWYDEAQKTMEMLNTKISQWHEHMEDVVLYLPSVEPTSCYNSIFQHLSQFLVDFYRAWEETEQLKVLEMAGNQYARVTTKAKQTSEGSKTNENNNNSLEMHMTMPLPPPPPPPMQLSISSTLSAVTSVN